MIVTMALLISSSLFATTSYGAKITALLGEVAANAPAPALIISAPLDQLNAMRREHGDDDAPLVSRLPHPAIECADLMVELLDIIRRGGGGSVEAINPQAHLRRAACRQPRRPARFTHKAPRRPLAAKRESRAQRIST